MPKIQELVAGRKLTELMVNLNPKFHAGACGVSMMGFLYCKYSSRYGIVSDNISLDTTAKLDVAVDKIIELAEDLAKEIVKQDKKS